jgi:hypothetical protein
MSFFGGQIAKMKENAPASGAVSPEIITPIGKWPEKGKWVRIRPGAAGAQSNTRQ